MRLERIRQVLDRDFIPVHLEVHNDSGLHRVPEGSETHVRIVIVSPKFDGLSRLQRQRLVHSALSVEFSTGLHALSLLALSPQEDEKNRASGSQGALTPTPCAHQEPPRAQNFGKDNSDG